MKNTIFFLLGFSIAGVLYFLLWRFDVTRNDLLDAIADRNRTIVNVVDRSKSPDGEYSATTHKIEYGSEGSCEVRINVHRTEEVFNFDFTSEYICSTGCDTGLDLTWTNNRELNISYSSIKPDEGVRTYQQFETKDKAVKISFDLKQ